MPAINESTGVSAQVDTKIAFQSSMVGIPDLEALLGHVFARPDLLEQALTHTSHARERDAQKPHATASIDNEQMEFLGDAVLGLVAAEQLCLRFPTFREGELSKLRAHLISEKHLVRVAQEMRLGNYLRLGKGEEKSGGRDKTAILVDALEAMIAALYLDGGITAAREFIVRKVMDAELERISNNGSKHVLTDYKSALQEKLQAIGKSQATYVLVKQTGPDHKKTFTVEARLPNSIDQSGTYVGRAEGSTKKSAEQESARLLLEHLLATSTVEHDGSSSKPGAL